MSTKEILKTLMNDKGFTYQALADKTGYKRASNVSELVKNDNNMRLSGLLKLLNAMDCEIVIRSKLKDKSEWVVE